MFLFIFESIGTSELILIAGVALIVFGPRKLPQMAKTIAKTMAEFKNATNEFKSTWEKEANFDVETEKKVVALPETENQIAKVTDTNEMTSLTKNDDLFPTPTIKELSAEDIAARFPSAAQHAQDSKPAEKIVEKVVPGKQDWL